MDGGQVLLHVGELSARGPTHCALLLALHARVALPCAALQQQTLMPRTGGLHMHLDGTMLRAQLLQEAVWTLRAAEDELGECGHSIAFCVCISMLC